MKFNNFLTIIFISFFSANVFSNELTFKGLSKLSLEDIQTITNEDIYQKNASDDQINSIIRDLYSSDLIYDVKSSKTDSKIIFEIIESKIINKIYINGNLRIKDEDIINNLKNKTKSFHTIDFTKYDLNTIEQLYASKGYNNIFITASTENFPGDKINLIFQIDEGEKQNLSSIKFIGNSTFSKRILDPLLTLKAQGILDFLSTSNELDLSVVDFDQKKIIEYYKDKGFFDVEVSYEIKSKYNNYILLFYISEGDRYKVDKIDYVLDTNLKEYDLDNLDRKFSKNIEQNSFFYDKDIIKNHVDFLNDELIKKNILDKFISAELLFSEDKKILRIFDTKQQIVSLNKIDFVGNQITKDKTLRSKLEIQPGDFINQNSFIKLDDRLNKLKYVNNVQTEYEINDNLVDVIIEVDENSKSGNLLAAGSLSGDTGFGITFGVSDFNFLGSGNEIDANFNFNEEDTLFKISYTQSPYSNPNLKNNYVIFNQEKDLLGSFGFKSDTQGIGYSLLFDYDENTSISTGINFESQENTNAKINKVFINDNIGSFQNIDLKFSINHNTLNDFLFPTKGFSNSISITYSPESISDNPRYEVFYKNKNFVSPFENDDSYFFLINNLGIADSLEGKLKTVNAFSLGGLNFKGFDYRGIGPFDSNIYLGGNNLFTSTFGLGSSFIFDESDNIMYKIFYSTGSVWGSDYVSDSFDLRSSVGVSLDILTPILPISFSYAVPIDKNTNDKVRNFTFTIGTSF